MDCSRGTRWRCAAVVDSSAASPQDARLTRPPLYPFPPTADGFVREALPGVKKAGSAAAKKQQAAGGGGFSQPQAMQIAK